MRPTETVLRSWFDEFNWIHFHGEVPVVPIEINERMTSTAGRASWKYGYRSVPTVDNRGRVSNQSIKICKPSRIEISGPIFDHFGWDFVQPGWPMTEARLVLLHEMVHIYLVHLYNDEGHSTHFHNLMNRFTGIVGNHRCHHLNISEVQAAREVQKSVAKSKKGRVATGVSLF